MEGFIERLPPGTGRGGLPQAAPIRRVRNFVLITRRALLSSGWSAVVRRMDSVILATEALKLPALERAQIIDALWRSLEPAEQTSIDQAWLAESRDRLRAFREGELKRLEGEETLREIEAGLRP